MDSPDAQFERQLDLEEEELINEVLEYCNKVRKANGAVEIERLIAGIEGDPQRCLVANSVNCGLGVSGIADDPMGHWALFASTQDAHVALMKVALEFGEETVYRIPNGWRDEGGPLRNLSLPSLVVPNAVRRLATKFDRHELPPELYIQEG